MQVSIFVELEIYRTLLEYQGAKMWDIASWTERAKESWKKSWMTFWLEKLAALVTVAGMDWRLFPHSDTGRKKNMVLDAPDNACTWQ